MRRLLLVAALLAAGPSGAQAQGARGPRLESVAAVRVDADSDGVPDRAGEAVTILGNLTTRVYLGDEGDFRTHVQDGLAGVRIATSDAAMLAGLAPGDLVRITGRVDQRFGTTMIAVQAVERLARGAVPAPLEVDAARLLGEELEGRLVRLRGTAVVGTEVAVQDDSGRIPLRLGRELVSEPGFVAGVAGSRAVEVVGILEQYDPAPPFRDGYRIVPRERADVVAVPPVPWRHVAVATGPSALFLVVLAVWGWRARTGDQSALLLAERYRVMLDSQRRFLAEASHQIRTPLTVLRGSIEVALLRPRSAEEYRAVMEAALDDVKGVAELATDLITLARTDEGVDVPEMIGVHLDQLIDEVAATFRPGSKETRTDIGVVVEPGLVARADPVLLRRAVANVVDNAVKYASGAPILIEARTADDERIEIEVSDRGPGVPAAESARIFSRFYRSAERPPGVQGTGLGLSIARAIMQQHGGDLEHRPRPGGGSSFLFSLPRSGSARDARPA